MTAHFSTLTFERKVAAPVSTLWHAWTAPAARAVWSPPSPSVTVEIQTSEPRVGGREVSLCRVDGEPEFRCDAGWLHMDRDRQTVGYEVVSSEGTTRSAALVTADFDGTGEESRLSVTVQLSSLDRDMEGDYRAGFGAGLDNLAAVADRTMILTRRIAAPREIVWAAWTDPAALPRWWGPDGFSCRTKRIDLRAGGEWVFDMIAADGTVFPNHHRYHEMLREDRIGYALLWGENGPKHADAWAAFDEIGGATVVTLGMVFSSAAEFREAKGFGAIELGGQTLSKLARFVGAD